MTHLNETIYSSSIASAHEATPLPSGAWINDGMLANVCKHNVTRFPYEISRLAQDLAGGLMVTLPSEEVPAWGGFSASTAYPDPAWHECRSQEVVREAFGGDCTGVRDFS